VHRFVEPAQPTINQPLIANSLAWSPDGRWLAVATNAGSWLFDTKDQESDFRRVGRPSNDVAFRSNTELVIATQLLTNREYGFSFYETTSGRLLEQEITGWEGIVSPPPDPSYQSIDYAPDSTIYAYRQDHWIVVVDQPRELFLSQIADGSRTVELAFLPDASAALVLYITDDGGRIGIHDLGRPIVGKELLTPLDLEIDATSIALSADGSRFAIGGTDGKILLGMWSALEDIQAVAAVNEAIQSVTLSPDGATLVAAAGNLLIFIDMQSGEITSTLSTSLPINNLDYDPTGEQLAVLTERSIQLIEATSQESPLEFTEVGLRVSMPLTRHILRFDLPLPASTESDLRNPDKDALRQTILDLRAQGMSYRQIAEVVGLHWTRVGQIARTKSQ
jgi:WD40 repeat protein